MSAERSPRGIKATKTQDQSGHEQRTHVTDMYAGGPGVPDSYPRLSFQRGGDPSRLPKNHPGYLPHPSHPGWSRSYDPRHPPGESRWQRFKTNVSGLVTTGEWD